MNDTTQDGRTDPDEEERSWWATTWPLERFDAVRLAVAFASVVAVGVVIGEILTKWSPLSGLVDYDERLARDLADGRTDLKDDVAHWGAFIADTPVKIGISVVIAGFLLWKLRRWREAVLVGLPLIFEAAAYITTSFIVQRPRPDVERLLESPVDTSFPWATTSSSSRPPRTTREPVRRSRRWSTERRS